MRLKVRRCPRCGSMNDEWKQKKSGVVTCKYCGTISSYSIRNVKDEATGKDRLECLTSIKMPDDSVEPMYSLLAWEKEGT